MVIESSSITEYEPLVNLVLGTLIIMLVSFIVVLKCLVFQQKCCTTMNHLNNVLYQRLIHGLVL
jgi:hypothetical protein